MADGNASNSVEGDAHLMDRYSRQIGAYGIEAMGKLVKLRVMILGLRGVGVETAKNLILAGPGAVTLWDNETLTISDLGSNFCVSDLSESGEHVNKTRAEASAPFLRDLNRLVRVSVASGPLTEEVVREHDVVVATGLTLSEALRWNSFCRSAGVHWIQADVRGAFGYAFVDLGSSFTLRDKTGEQPVSRIIESISNTNPARVGLLPPPDGRRHNIEASDHEGWVEFDEIDGPMGDLLARGGPFKASHVYKTIADKKTGKEKRVFDAYALDIDVDASSLACPYEATGTMNQVKRPVEMKFRGLDENLDQPVAPGDYSLMFTDGAKFGRAEQLHVALRALWEFEEANGRLPEPRSTADANAVLDIARQQNAAQKGKENCLHLEEISEEVVRDVAMFASVELQPLCAFFGGVVAQEVVKVTGKFTPLHQWLHFDCFEVLPGKCEGEDAMDEEKESKEYEPMGSRYDDHIKIFGREFQQKLGDARLFLVGCGALGCEFLKNFALNGVACANGKITVTDNDRIEISNLSRQFLFREHNVGQPKSRAAAAAVEAMNPRINVDSKEILVAPHTESTFNDSFWEGLDFVTNALDNVKARNYVDGQCVFYTKPLLESGTLGTKCNVLSVLPHQTQSYSDGPSGNDDGDAIPMCTLRNFPSSVEHCIEWARAQFTDLFATTATEAANFVADPAEWLASLRSKTLDLGSAGRISSAIATNIGPVRAVRDMLRSGADVSFESCVRTAFEEFHRLFRNKIASLIQSYPADAKDKEGRPFWSGTKRFPQAAKFDCDNEWHVAFLVTFSNLLAVNYGLWRADEPVPADHPWRSKEHVLKIASEFEVPVVVVEKVDMSGQAGEEEAGEEKEEEKKDGMDDDDDDDDLRAEFDSILSDLASMSTSGLCFEPADFEKDADWNFHIDFITAAANMRAWNYRLKSVSRHKCKMIAGKIIPALATTTAAVTGLVMIEALKLVQEKKLGAFKDASCNLGINGYFFSEPMEPSKAKDEYDVIEMAEVKCRPPGFTKWDKTKIDVGDVTLSEFLAAFKESTGLNCTYLSHKLCSVKDSPGYCKFVYERDTWKKSLKATYGERMDQNLKDIIKQIYGDDAVTPETRYIMLDASVDDDNDNVYKVPTVVYHFRRS